MYKLTDSDSVIRLADGACIPMAEGNRDFAEYEAWIAQGNVPQPAHTEEELKASKITALKSTRDTLEVAPITTDKGVFDFDTKARDRLDIALKALTASGGSIAWTLADNTQVDVTSSDINNVFLAVATRSNELHEKYRALKEQVNACMDAESVSKVTWVCY